MTRRSFAFGQLSVLTATHYFTDLLGGMLPGFLPALLEKYSLSIAAGAALITFASLSVNGLQIWAGTLHRNGKRPRLVEIGLLSGVVIGLFGLVPTGAWAFPLLVLLVLFIGLGGALVHPAALRSVCAVDACSVSAATATSTFMMAGFLGGSTGPFLGGFLYERLGFAGFWLMLIPIGLLLWLGRRFRLRMASSDAAPKKKAPPMVGQGMLTFRQIFLLATLINCGCAIIQGLLVTFVKETQGFSMTFGGLLAMLFGLGAGTGAMLTGFLVRRFHVLKCIVTEILCGLPLLLLYLFFAKHAWAAVFLFPAGFLVGSGFPQLVVLARNAAGNLSLGMRMGLIVGGTWSIAGIAVLLVGQLAKYIGLEKAMFAIPVMFVAAIALAVFYLRNHHHRRATAA